MDNYLEQIKSLHGALSFVRKERDALKAELAQLRASRGKLAVGDEVRVRFPGMAATIVKIKHIGRGYVDYTFPTSTAFFSSTEDWFHAHLSPAVELPPMPELDKIENDAKQIKQDWDANKRVCYDPELCLVLWMDKVLSLIALLRASSINSGGNARAATNKDQTDANKHKG